VANIQSQIKRNKQNEKRRVRNTRIKSSLRTASKKVLKSIEAKENAEALNRAYASFVKTVDKAARDGVIHRNASARRKSRLAKKVNAAVKGLS
jgi:small subunit ribosomal protein S20